MPGLSTIPRPIIDVLEGALLITALVLLAAARSQRDVPYVVFPT
jgi:hypothetical protein